MPTYNPTLQKGRLADVPADVHGLISKKTAQLDGVAVTEVTFQAGARCMVEGSQALCRNRPV